MHETEAETRVGGREIVIPAGSVSLQGDLEVPETAHGVVLFAHGSGSSRHSRRNQFVARRLQEAGLATLLMDLLTPSEDEEDARTARLRFDMDLLARRLLAATDWLGEEGELRVLDVSYRGVDQPGRAYTCGGRVTGVDGTTVELEVWGRNESDERTTLGSAVVEMR